MALLTVHRKIYNTSIGHVICLGKYETRELNHETGVFTEKASVTIEYKSRDRKFLS